MQAGSRVFRTLLFAIIPAVALGIVATFVLSLLEQRGVIRTSRVDDILSFPPPDFVSRQRIGNEDYYRIRYAPRGDPMALETRFPVEKGANTLRIVVTGGSFAMGDPYVDPARPSPGFGSIGDWIQGELALRFPSLDIEVINAALGGTNSTGVREIVEQVAGTNPDLVLVITGNNDGHVFGTPLNRWLNRWIVYRALKKLLLPVPATRPRFAPQDADVSAIRAQFRANIERIVDVAEGGGFGLVLSTLPINYRYELPPGTPVQVVAAVGGSGVSGSNRPCDEVIADTRKEVLPGEFLRRGRCLEERNRFAEALQAYAEYVEAMPLGRVRPSLNAAVRAVARSKDIPLLDMERIANERSVNGIADQGLFFDNCHLLWRGYAMMARAAVDLILGKKLLDTKGARAGARPTLAQIIEANGWQALHTFRPVPIPYAPPAPLPDSVPGTSPR